MAHFLPSPIEDYLAVAEAAANALSVPIEDGKSSWDGVYALGQLCATVELARQQRRVADALEEQNANYRKAHDIYE